MTSNKLYVKSSLMKTNLAIIKRDKFQDTYQKVSDKAQSAVEAMHNYGDGLISIQPSYENHSTCRLPCSPSFGKMRRMAPLLRKIYFQLKQQEINIHFYSVLYCTYSV